MSRKECLVFAAKMMDWHQVSLNYLSGGPPCFHLDGNYFCGRAERWEGHFGLCRDHKFVSFGDLLKRVVPKHTHK